MCVKFISPLNWFEYPKTKNIHMQRCCTKISIQDLSNACMDTIWTCTAPKQKYNILQIPNAGRTLEKPRPLPAQLSVLKWDFMRLSSSCLVRGTAQTILMCEVTGSEKPPNFSDTYLSSAGIPRAQVRPRTACFSLTSCALRESGSLISKMPANLPARR